MAARWSVTSVRQRVSAAPSPPDLGSVPHQARSRPARERRNRLSGASYRLSDTAQPFALEGYILRTL